MKIIAVDIGGTSIKAGEVIDGVLVSSTEYDTGAKSGGESVMLRVKDIIAGYSGFEAVGISTAGQVDSLRGCISFANENIPGYTGMQVKNIMEQHFKVPVAVENDVNCAALGEAHYGAGRGLKDFICLAFGTGIGGAVVIDRKIYAGSTFSAAEFGHIITHAGGRHCNCGLSGCYEQYASTGALVAAAAELNPALSNGRIIFEHMGDPGVQEIVDQWIREIIYGLVTIIHIFNPADIILGGGIMNENYIAGRIKDSIKDNIMPSYAGVAIRQASLGNRAGMLGAAYLASRTLSP